MLSEKAANLKKRFSEMKDIKRYIDNLERVIMFREKHPNLVGAPNLGVPMSKGGERLSKQEAHSFKLDELKRLQEKAIEEYMFVEDCFINDIQHLKLVEQNILFDLYQNNKTINATAKNQFYSKMQILRVRDKALEKIILIKGDN